MASIFCLSFHCSVFLAIGYDVACLNLHCQFFSNCILPYLQEHFSIIVSESKQEERLWWWSEKLEGVDDHICCHIIPTLRAEIHTN